MVSMRKQKRATVSRKQPVRLQNHRCSGRRKYAPIYFARNDSDIYDVSVVDYLDIVRYGVGDTITFEYMEGEQANTVLGIENRTMIVVTE